MSGTWPWPDAEAEDALRQVVGVRPDGAVVLVDGLIACPVPNVLVPEARRLAARRSRPHALWRLGRPDTRSPTRGLREFAVLSAARAIITTSSWTRQQLLDLYRLPPERIHVAEPGAHSATPSPGTAGGTELLCVAAVTPHKGHDTLLASLAVDRRPALALRLCRSAGSRSTVRRPAAAPSRSGRHRRPHLAHRRASSVRISTAPMPPRTSWFSRPMPRRTAWWSRKPWPAGYRSSRRRLVACPTLSVAPWAGGARAFSCRPMTRAPSASRSTLAGRRRAATTGSGSRAGAPNDAIQLVHDYGPDRRECCANGRAGDCSLDEPDRR